MLSMWPVDEAIKTLANEKLLEIEKYLDTDFISLFGSITNGLASLIRNVVDDIASDKCHKKLSFMLTTTGGSVNFVCTYKEVYLMLTEEVKKLLSPCSRRNDFTVIQQIKYIEDLERQGIIERPIPQTAYKYPVDILPNCVYKYVD